MISKKSIKLKCSQMDIVALDRLQDIGNKQFDKLRDKSTSEEEKEGFEEEREIFNEAIEEVISDKFFDFIEGE